MQPGCSKNHPKHLELHAFRAFFLKCMNSMGCFTRRVYRALNKLVQIYVPENKQKKMIKKMR